jgi:hypothetical protein
VGDVQVEHVEERPRVGMAFLVLDLIVDAIPPPREEDNKLTTHPTVSQAQAGTYHGELFLLGAGIAGEEVLLYFPEGGGLPTADGNHSCVGARTRNTPPVTHPTI